MLTHGFPNLLMPTGPQGASATTNFPRGIETGVNWCTELMRYMWARGATRADVSRAAEERWAAHVAKMYEIMLMRKAKGWFTGYNSNIDGHEAGKVALLRLQRRHAEICRDHQRRRRAGL